MQVLVIEDNDADVELVRLSLRRSDKKINVTAVPTMRDALRAVEDNDYDIALLDLSLPDSFGLGSVRELQRAKDTMPIVVLSGEDNENTVLSAARLGVEDYLVKGNDVGPNMVRTLRYAIERKKGENRLRNLADYDQLTGLANRQRFNRQLLKALGHSERSGERIGVLFVDLDEFKQVNDTLGHAVGDQLLKQVALRFRACVRKGDLVGRLGGDEFAIIAEALSSPYDAEVVAEKVIEAMQIPFSLSGHSVRIGASVGIALSPEDADDAEQLVTRADMAMYQAKRNGRGSMMFYAGEMNRRAEERNKMLQELANAVTSQQFEVHYQPKACARTHNLIGIEALVRWRHPVRGLLFPTEFIPFAEEHGLISAIDEQVLEKVASDLVDWESNGYNVVPVSVNVSASHVLRGDVYESMRDLIRRTGMRAEFLELELTESVLRAEYAETCNALSKIRDLGVKIWLDDFGTGYSSMSYLREFPLDGICIDKSFVAELDNSRARAIVKSIVSLAHNLGLGVGAVGVESAEQLDVLKAMGCDRAQGYFYGEPMVVAELRDRFLIQRDDTVTGIMRAMPLQRNGT